MSDISKEFLKELENEFERRYSSDSKIQKLIAKLNSGKASSQDAFNYAKEVGNLRKLVLHDLITEDILNDGYLGYYNAKALFDDVLFKDYELINQYCVDAFTQINKDAGINLKGVSVEYDQDKTNGVIECAVKDRYMQTRNETEEAVITNAKGYYDSSVRKNADTQYKAGLKPRIIRTAVGKTCKWCQSVAGTYDYREVSDKGNDVFRRHSNCDCLVVYQPSKGSYQDVHSKQWMNTKEYQENLKKRIEYSEIRQPMQTPQQRISRANRKFNEAISIREAEEYARSKLGISNVSYQGVDIKTANEWNNGLRDTFIKYPELKKNFDFVGEAHARNKYLKPLVKNAVEKDIAKNHSNWTQNQKDSVIKRVMNQFSRKMAINSNVWAESCPGLNWLSLTFEGKGICVNGDFGKDSVSFISSIENSVITKFHPEGCGTIKYVLDHEVGHQLDDLLGISSNQIVKDIWNNTPRTDLTDKLSRYSWDNSNKNPIREMVAEAYGEYRNNPNPREIARIIGSLIDDEYKKQYGVKQP